jgi:hypothetical protein
MARVVEFIPGPRTIASAKAIAVLTAPPAQAFTNLFALAGLVMHGVQTRLVFSADVTLSGTTVTDRIGSFRLVDGVTPVAGADIRMTDEVVEASRKWTVNMDFIITPIAGTHTFAVQWATNANATMVIDGTDTSHGFGQLQVEELASSGTTLVGLVNADIFVDTRIVNNPRDMAEQINLSFAAVLLANPLTELVDISVSGGGAGNVFELVILYKLPTEGETLIFPLVADQFPEIGFGPDRTTMNASVNRLFTGEPANILNFWSTACAGDGAIWMTILIFEEGAGPGPGLLAAARSFEALTAAQRVEATQAAKDIGALREVTRRRMTSTSIPKPMLDAALRARDRRLSIEQKVNASRVARRNAAQAAIEEADELDASARRASATTPPPSAAPPSFPTYSRRPEPQHAPSSVDPKKEK